MSDALWNVSVVAVGFLAIGAAASLRIWFKLSRLDRAQRERPMFTAAIPRWADTLAQRPNARLFPSDWVRILSAFRDAGFTMDEAWTFVQELTTPDDQPWDFLEFLTAKNAWSLDTFGPGDARDRLAGLSDHIQKELVELQADPMDVEEWIDLTFLALDGAFRAGADPATVARTLNGKLKTNMARRWPDWRTAEPGKAIEHDRDRSES